MTPDALDLLLTVARTGILLARSGGRVWHRPSPAPRMADAIDHRREDLLPLLLPVSLCDWPRQWRHLFKERRALDQHHYRLSDEAAGFVAEGWVRLAYARWVAGHPPAGSPWADLVIDDLLLVVVGYEAEGAA